MNSLELIAERQNTHGDFRQNGRVMQAIKDLLRTGPSWSAMEPFQREGVDMIAHKLGRIVCGDPNYLDHWDDIAGYATRVTTIIRSQQEGTQCASTISTSLTHPRTKRVSNWFFSTRTGIFLANAWSRLT
jgi:hypothetical protein